MGPSTTEFRTRAGYKYFARHSRLQDVENSYLLMESTPGQIPEAIPHLSLSSAAITTSSRLAHQNTPFDVFGLLHPDLQIEILGYVAVYRPAQIIHMRRVCKQWKEILSQDSIYHSALFTASFSHPPEISREAFEQVAFTDDRLRKLIFSKAKGLPCSINPTDSVYRDGFLVWWPRYNKNRFIYVDFNKTKPSSRRHIIKTTLSSEAGQEFLKTPVYALGGGTLVYMMNSEEAASKGGNLSLHAVRLKEPPERGNLRLSNLRHLAGPLELYCSSDFVLVVRALNILVGDATDLTAMKALRVIPLREHTYLSSPVVDSIEIGNNGRCLVILKSTDSVESLTFSLTTGSLLRRCSTNCPLDSRLQAHQFQTTYHVQNDREFARDTQYQKRNTTHKECAPTAWPDTIPHQYRWLQTPAVEGNEAECITGSYISPGNQPTQHRVTFVKQGLSFSAFEDESCNHDNVGWNRLKITTGLLAAEDQDLGPTGRHNITPRYHADIDKARKITYWWGPSARASPPPDCVTTNGDGDSVTNYDRWLQNRRRWPQTGRLLGDEKALILVLPHQLVIWKFQTLQMWRDRRRHRIKYLALEGVKDAVKGVWFVICVGVGGSLMVAVGAVICVVMPVLVVTGVYAKKKKQNPEPGST